MSSPLPERDSPQRVTAPSIAERVAVLEEVTREKPPSFVDGLKNWGGVASLVIALAYSFPIGLWDKFYVSRQEAMVREVSRLRDVVDQSTAITAEGATAVAGIHDPTLKDTVARAINTRLYVLMSKNRDAFVLHLKRFSAPEALVIGYGFFTSNQTDVATDFLRHAETTSGDDRITRVEAMRLRARTHFLPGRMQDRALGRRVFREAIAIVDRERNLQSVSTSLNLSAEWGLFELVDGDWACGQQQLDVARAKYQAFAPLFNDQGNFIRMIDGKVGVLRRQPDQPAEGCDGAVARAGPAVVQPSPTTGGSLP